MLYDEELCLEKGNPLNPSNPQQEMVQAFGICKKSSHKLSFMDQQLNSDPVTIQRIYPRSNEAKQYTMDSLDLKGMQKVINDERRKDNRYISIHMN